MVNNKRIAAFKQGITDTLAQGDTAFMRNLLEQYQQEHDIPALDIAAALARQVIGDRHFLLKPDRPDSKKSREKTPGAKKRDRDDRPKATDRPSSHRSDSIKSKESKNDRARAVKGDDGFKPPKRITSRDKSVEGVKAADNQRARPEKVAKVRDEHSAPAAKAATDRPKPKRQEHTDKPEKGMERFRLAVGKEHEVAASNIVGAIANEAGLDAHYIGQINIQQDHSFVDLPEGMPKDIFKDLRNIRVCGHKLGISRLQHEAPDWKKKGKGPKVNKDAKAHKKKTKKAVSS